MDVVAKNRELVINGRQIELSEAVADTLVIDDVVIVRVDSDRDLGEGDRSLNRNVLAFNGAGERLWEIQEAPHGDDDWPKPYTAIAQAEAGLTATNWIGVTYDVHLETGQVTAVQAAGRPW